MIKKEGGITRAELTKLMSTTKRERKILNLVAERHITTARRGRRRMRVANRIRTMSQTMTCLLKASTTPARDVPLVISVA